MPTFPAKEVRGGANKNILSIIACLAGGRLEFISSSKLKHYIYGSQPITNKKPWPIARNTKGLKR